MIETVLITGHQGFTGLMLQKKLQHQGYSVHGLSANLMDRDAIRQMVAQISPDYVIHLAGISNVVHEDFNALYQINCFGTLNLLSAIQEENIPVKKIVLASSAYVYGNTTTELISEKTCPKPHNHYAMSKLAMEHMALSLYEKLPIVIARPFNYTGIGQKTYFLLPKIIHHFVTRASKIYVGNTHVYREFNDVRMTLQAYESLMLKAELGTIVNICTGKSYCVQEILDLCQKISQHQIEILVDPKLVRANEAVKLAGDPTLLRSIVPGLPNYTLEETLRWMFDDMTTHVTTCSN